MGRTRVQIDALKDKLLGAGQGKHPAVHSTTVLSCDWIDTQKLAFNNSRDAAGEPLHPENLTGCHLPVEAGDADQVFDCFNGAGRPQGCHAYAKAKVARLRFTTGCFQSHWPLPPSPLRWGWCGRFPWSQHDLPVAGRDQDVGCHTVADAVWYVLSVVKENGFVLSSWGTTLYVMQRSLRTLNTTVDNSQKMVKSLRDRATGKHGKEFFNRVSLSLNILADGSEEGKTKLSLRTCVASDPSPSLHCPRLRLFLRVATERWHWSKSKAMGERAARRDLGPRPPKSVPASRGADDRGQAFPAVERAGAGRAQVDDHEPLVSAAALSPRTAPQKSERTGRAATTTSRRSARPTSCCRIWVSQHARRPSSLA